MAKQVAKSKLDKMVKAYTSEVVTQHIKIGDDEVDIDVRQTLTYPEFVDAVNDFTELVFTKDDSGKEVYHRENEEFARRYVFLKYFTNVDMDPQKKDGTRDPNFVSRVWGVYQMVDDYEDGWCASSMVYAIIDSAIDRIRSKRKELTPDAVQFWTKLNEFADAMKDQFGEMSEEDMKNASAAITKLANIRESDIVNALSK